jgi:hypothetical protein
MNFEKKVMTLTKAEGALRQIKAAIEAFWRGDFDIAITLSGAAEGMLEEKRVICFCTCAMRRKCSMFQRRNGSGR